MWSSGSATNCVWWICSLMTFALSVSFPFVDAVRWSYAALYFVNCNVSFTDETEQIVTTSPTYLPAYLFTLYLCSLSYDFEWVWGNGFASCCIPEMSDLETKFMIAKHAKAWDAAFCYKCSMVCGSVCVYVIATVNPTPVAELTELGLLFGGMISGWPGKKPCTFCILGASPSQLWSIGNIQHELFGRWQQRCGLSLSVLQQLVVFVLGFEGHGLGHGCIEDFGLCFVSCGLVDILAVYKTVRTARNTRMTLAI